MKKITISLVLLGVIFLSGCHHERGKNKLQPKTDPLLNQAEILNQNEIIKDEFAIDLCNEGFEKYFNEKYEYSLSVSKCGDYYLISPKYILDIGWKVIDENGDEVAYCGGMPGPERSVTDSKCEIDCSSDSSINLCSGIEIDCSKIEFKNTSEDRHTGADENWYSAKRDYCYFENMERMSDKRYCEMIVDSDYKKRCNY